MAVRSICGRFHLDASLLGFSIYVAAAPTITVRTPVVCPNANCRNCSSDAAISNSINSSGKVAEH